MKDKLIDIIAILALIAFVIIQFYRYFDPNLFGRPHITSWLFIIIPIFLFLQRILNKWKNK